MNATQALPRLATAISLPTARDNRPQAKVAKPRVLREHVVAELRRTCRHDTIVFIALTPASVVAVLLAFAWPCLDSIH